MHQDPVTDGDLAGKRGQADRTPETSTVPARKSSLMISTSRPGIPRRVAVPLAHQLTARLTTAPKGSALVRAVRAGRRAGPGGFGEPGVQSLPDLLRGVGAAAALGPDDHHSAGGDASEACQSQYLQPAHATRLLPCPQ